jgi:hypothetical protein
MKIPYYGAGKMRDYGGEKSHVMAEMIPASMTKYWIQNTGDL